MLYQIQLYYIILYYIILYYITLYYILLYYIILHSIILYYIILYYIILEYIILYYVRIYYTILYIIILLYFIMHTHTYIYIYTRISLAISCGLLFIQGSSSFYQTSLATHLPWEFVVLVRSGPQQCCFCLCLALQILREKDLPALVGTSSYVWPALWLSWEITPIKVACVQCWGGVRQLIQRELNEVTCQRPNESS